MLFRKKKESKEEINQKQEINSTGIYVLGSGCPKCNLLEENVKEALSKLEISEDIQHITDFKVIAEFGVMSTPALVIDNSVVSYGKVISVEECIEILKNHRK